MKNQKGFTGADLSIAVIIIVLFVGLIMTIFYNIYLASSRIQRSTNANNLAISLLERVEGMEYDKIKEGTANAEGEYQIDSGTADTGTTMDVLKGIFVPKGYGVRIEITNYNQTEGNEGKEDIIKIVKLEIKYKVGKEEEKLEMQTLKEKNKKNVNSPKLAEGMTPVKWNGTGWEETTASDPQWYDYKDTLITGADTSLWANAKTKDGSMWVWIPRYSYSIKSGYHTNETGEIDVRFLKGTTDEYYREEGTADRTPNLNNTNTAMANYVVHPSFTNGQINNYANSGWDKELDGYWVAKYPISRSDASNTKVGINEVAKIQANVQAWYIEGGLTNMYSICKNMNNSKLLSGDAVFPHLIKNSEWGAVVYLTYSKYGINQRDLKGSDTPNITGSGTVETSTTYNMTGIYDIAGQWEYTAAYSGYKNENIEIMKSIVEEKELKYKDVYQGYTSEKFGDAIYETSSTSGGNNVGWRQSYFYSPVDEAHPTFPRGGNIEGNTGLFFSSSSLGGSSQYCRPVLII